MLKKVEINIADTNMANFGTQLEKNIKEAAALHELAWTNQGQKPGLMIWRIEKFHVVPWPIQSYGSFYSGDSYIILHTQKLKSNDKLIWDIYFWLGTYTTQDEAGTAAYKTVELDDFLGGAPVQHREIQGFESEAFQSLFPNLTYLEGGIDSGFKHVEAEKYNPRLLKIKGKKVVEVPLTANSLNSACSFILDKGLDIYVFHGKKSTPTDKHKIGQIANGIKDQRKGLPKVQIFEEDDKDAEDFWKILGGKTTITAEDSNANEAYKFTGEKRLMEIVEEGGKMDFVERGKGNKVKIGLLDTNGVFVFDAGFQIFVWVGSKATALEKKSGMQYAQNYLNDNKRPSQMSISLILEGGENDLFRESFN